MLHLIIGVGHQGCKGHPDDLCPVLPRGFKECEATVGGVELEQGTPFSEG